MEDVKKIIGEIKASNSKKSSQKDEVRVMKAMLNDKEYKVGVYGKEGKEGEVCPSAEAREMITSVISSTTKIKKEEAEQLADSHEFDKKEAEKFVNVSKEFINTYLESGRRLPLGRREKTSTSLIQEELEPAVKSYSHRIGINEDGSPIWEDPRPTKEIPGYNKTKASSPCPGWVK